MRTFDEFLAESAGASKDLNEELLKEVSQQLPDGDRMKELLEGGADPNCINPEGFTPLHLLVYSASDDNEYAVTEAIELLLKFGADPLILDSHGRSSIEAAEASIEEEPPIDPDDPDSEDLARAVYERNEVLSYLKEFLIKAVGERMKGTQHGDITTTE